jgi:hypothetical protein
LAPVLLFPLPGDEFGHLEKSHHKIEKGFQEMCTELLLLALAGKKSRTVGGRWDSARISCGE